MQTKILSIYALIVSVTLAGVLFSCSSFSIPSFEKFIDNSSKLMTMYCSEGMEDTRAAILHKIRETHPEYPEHGFCGITSPDLIG